MWIKKSEAILKCFTHVDLRGGSRIFLRRGYTRLLLDFNTNKLHSFLFVFFFLLQNTSCIRKPQVISRGGGGGGAHPLHPPLRSATVYKIIKGIKILVKDKLQFC